MTVLQNERKRQFFLIHQHLFQPWAYSAALCRNCCSSDILKPPVVLPEIQFYSHETDGSVNALYIHHQMKARYNQLSITPDLDCRLASETVGIQVMQLIVA